MARTYKRDSNGRFAGGGGGSGGGRPAARSVSRGTNRLTRDNAGKITSVGGNGATARGGRLRTASGNQRATQTARVKGGGAEAGVMKGRVARNPGAMGKAGAGKAARTDRIGDQHKARDAAKGQQASKKKDALDVYAGGMGAMRGAKARAALDRNVMSDGKLQSTRALIEGKIKAGYSVSNGAKGARLVSSDGRYLTEKQVTKTGIGYAKLLSSARDAKKGGRLGGTRKLTRQTPGTIKGTVKRNPQAGAKLAGRGKVRKPDLGQSAFERRAKVTEKRARQAEKAVAGLDRYNPANRRVVNKANALRSAADSYSSLARRGKMGEFSAAYLFGSRSKASTAPKQTRSQKAAATRSANAEKRRKDNIRRMEQSRR